MYSILYTVKGHLDHKIFSNFHELINFILGLAKIGYEEIIIKDYKGAVIYKGVEIEREEPEDFADGDDYYIGLRESLGDYWW